MFSNKVLVIGATGKTGQELVKLLTGHGVIVRAATRNPHASILPQSDSLEIVEFDFERPATFAQAVRGVNAMFLMARPGDNRSDKAAEPLIDAARAEGIGLIVNLTAMGVELDETFMLRRLERYVEQSGIAYTHLRPNWFMQNFNAGPMYADIMTTGALHLPAADARLSFIDVRDIAAVGFAALTESRHAGKAYTLTGGEALDHTQVVEKLSSVAGRRIAYVPISEEVARAALAKAQVPEEHIQRWTEFFRKVRGGLCAPVHRDVETILDRPPISFDEYARAYAPAWKKNVSLQNSNNFT